MLVPLELGDGNELWDAVEGSRWHLERWLPWVPFNNAPEASVRYAEACVSDWDAGRAVRSRFATGNRASCSAWLGSTRACTCTAPVSSAIGCGERRPVAAS